MSPLAEVALVGGVVFAINLLPAFGPPTWAVLVFLSFHVGIGVPALVCCGAIAAAGGRMALAAASRRFRGRLAGRAQANLEAARSVLERNRKGSIMALALFALSPLPSGQLFVAAGLMDLRIVPLTVAFFAGRLVSYTVYLTAANLARESLSGVFGRVVGSPLAIALQLLCLGGLVALVRVDWADLARRFADRRATGRRA